MKRTWHKDDLIDLKPKHDVLVAIDSDGCVFDSMTIKQRIFHTGMIQFWGLEEIEPEFRQVAEWTALYSPWRGLNRFELLLKIFQCLERNCVAAQRFATQGRHDFQGLEKLAEKVPNIGKMPDTKSLEAFVKSGVPLSAEELAKRITQTGDLELKRALDWSRSVSQEIAAVPEMPVFGEVFQTLEKVRATADSIVVSQTQEEALVREWRNAGLEQFIDVIAGAELGSKIESLGTAMKGRYAPERTVMVGDAPGDLETARATGCLFFPIIPGAENASWIELREEGLARVLAGTFSRTYQDDLMARFNAVLSETPPWQSETGGEG
jgi:phosphoglycolate phosphatase-like HAD superfamily hydrolase